MKTNSKNKCVFILADGARKDVFKYLIKKGYLENISKYILEKGKLLDGVTVFPSTTGPAYTPFLLGKFPGPCDLPGIRWFDRRYYDKDLFSLKRFRSYIGLETYLINNDISKNYKTIFELFPNSVNILNEITRGLALKKDKTKFLKLYLKLKGHFTSGSDEVDEVAGKLLIKSLSSNPDFIFSVFMGIDSYSHQYHPFHKKVIDSYLRLDKYIGLLASRLKSRGELQQTLIIVGSDHGLTPTHSHFDSLYYLENKGYKPLYYTNIFKHFFNADTSVMVSGNSMAHYYFKNGGKWETNTYRNDIPQLIDELADRPEIDIVCAREEEGKIYVRGDNGDANIWFDGEGMINYRSISGDIFGYGLKTIKMLLNEGISNSIKTEYPDAIVQILQLFESPRTGDVVLSAKPGFDLRATHEKPEHCGSHGSLRKEHMMVPILINEKVEKDHARTVDIFPTIIKHLGSNIPEDIDGESLIS